MNAYEKVQQQLRRRPKTWLVTGAAGFIGSHLVEKLLALDQKVVGLDNFMTGRKTNLSAVRQGVSPSAWKRFTFIQGDVRDLKTCRRVARSVDYVLHQAALGSVQRSIDDPLTSHDCNVNGFLNMLVAARDAKAKCFVYASSSSVYGSEETLPKIESRIGDPISPYALTKRVDELYAQLFSRCYGVKTIGLRYFNVFGPRQDPNGPYAAVIPRWVDALRNNRPVLINGDGETSRDFCFVANVVQANILAAVSRVTNDVFNVACFERTTLNQLFTLLRDQIQPRSHGRTSPTPRYKPFRAGDVRHSLADIGKIGAVLGYKPSHSLSDGIRETLNPSESDPEE